MTKCRIVEPRILLNFCLVQHMPFQAVNEESFSFSNYLIPGTVDLIESSMFYLLQYLSFQVDFTTVPWTVVGYSTIG